MYSFWFTSETIQFSTQQTVQDQYEELTRSLESTSYVSHSAYTESWLRSFVRDVVANQSLTREEFYGELRSVSSLKSILI